MSDKEKTARATAVGMERKLTAILVADVQGYSRLMGEDEVTTLRTLTAYRKLVDTLIEQHHGRIVSTAGDSILAEFTSVINAVQCAVVIQTTLRAENANLPPDRRMEFRIGIHLGDVMVEGEQIYGDGVNIAARIEALAEGGSLCISDTVYHQIENKLRLRYEDLGEHQVKNIKKPVRVYHVGLEVPSPLVGEGRGEGAASRAGAATTPHPNLPPQGGKEPGRRRRVGIAHRAGVVVAGLALIVGMILTVRYFTRPPLSTQDSALRTEAASAALPLPDKPSIAVLPFTNISGDPEREYFSDGITEDLITDLSKLSGLFVIARNSVFTYKGKPVKVQEVGRELGVQYVLEGSVRKIGNRVLITAQLVDAPTGHHVWSERYDREPKDIFALQEEIRRKIVAYLAVRLTEGEQERAWRQYTSSPEAYDYLLRGLEYVNRSTKEANAQAWQMFEKAIELDPTYAVAYASLSLTYFTEWTLQWSQDPQILERAFALAQQAIALDDSLSTAHSMLGQIYTWRQQHDQAIAEGERAILLAPNCADCYVGMAGILSLSQRPTEAVGLVEKAMRLNPQYPGWYPYILGYAYRVTGRYEEAIEALKNALARRSPCHLFTHLNLAAAYSELDRTEEAQAEAAEVLRISPNFSVEEYGRITPQKDQAITERTLAALRKAGLK
ncbi:MAG TPA: adenylate/guanylate cyclase domain-containing protein [Candidatus Binatia bacterium]|nr:adenylate/guanylate cyclase domain-containing protein [Candidatus Binatia bacterium]